MKFIFLFVLVAGCHLSIAQDRCGTMLFNESKSSMDQQEQKIQFENWLKQEIFQKQIIKQNRAAVTTSETLYEIPVVVHVVHQASEPEGTGGNIPMGQITSQINTLNEDFRRMNADRVNTPAEFEDAAADVKLEFVLAKRDPEGLPTSGVVRVVGNQDFYSISQAKELAANSYWPAEEYLNIWVAHMSGGLLGFAKFPVSNEPGMDEDPNLNRLIDGVYVDYEYFGTGFNADDFSKGRTLVHEVGHWLGLRHIWGDGGCSVDDFCTDTPVQGSSSSGCPDVSQTSCSTIDMFQNYMDYTDDECMNLFTNCQGDRMRTVLENSPRRKELLSSSGAQEAIQVANDLGIRSVISPTFGNCSLELSPQVEVRNYGSNNISSFSIELLLDGEVQITDSYVETLIPLQSIFVDLSEISISKNVEEISIKILSVNGGIDGNADNDCESVSTFFPSIQIAPLTEDYEGTEESIAELWKMKNSNLNPPAWGFATAPNATIENKAAMLSYYGAPGGSFGELDYLLSPVLDLTELPTADLKFKYAYANHDTNLSDALTVMVSTDCGATFPQDNILFQKIGAELSTSPATNSLFVPADQADWVEIDINFGEFSTKEVVIAFVGSNGGGNNLYLDDIQIYSSAANEYDIGITAVESLPMVTCEEDIVMNVQVKNFGSQVITSFSVNYEFGSRSNSVNVNSDLNLLPGKTEVVEIESYNLENNKYQMDVVIERPNGEVDQDKSNNFQTVYFEIDTLSEVIPVRQKFAKTLEGSGWYYWRSDAPTDWTISEFREENVSNYALSFMGYDIDELGVENWFVSPILDFSATEEASMTFDVSYANKSDRNDQLQILASTNCGRVYPIEVYNKKGSALAIAQSESAWSPVTTEDWRNEFVDLSDLVGDQEVRLAFVVTNQNGNNLYLDNIEFYVSADENQIVITESMRAFPNPATDYIEVKFNFNIKEEILLRIMSLDGDVIAEQSFPNTLNQVYRIDHIQSTNNGMYILQAIGDFTNLSNKIIIHQ
ncbi:MAG: choice-of-anchor J domain-containing protein [Reichenbachiella sp.]|uniref:T9SS-dependent choice-of-anchor J family protein n=1 Tax=Reichenbachiella sp. TaxID=2184521 RepID=UPI002967591F|nr:choice-of-anchor J domain-containing protein [Reichenbachiella sp.]MDW3210361.1 choice-of-anchor J domain-containing protein [Reichenbachiella sp.]